MDIEPVLRVSSDVAPFAPSTTQSVLLDRSGSVFVSHRFRPPAIVVYDSGGTFVSLYDREGDGPGELRGAGQLWPAPDGSILIVDGYDTHRLARFDHRMQLIETVRTELPAFQDLVALRSGEFAVEHALETSDGEFTVALLGPDGRLIEPAARSDWTEAGIVMAAGADRGFWTINMVDVELKHYGDRGEEGHSVVVDIPWFPPRESRDLTSWTPAPKHMSLSDVGEGRVLLLTWVAQDGAEADERPIAVTPATMLRNPRFDSVLQLVDTRTGTILAHRRVDQALWPVQGPCASDLFFSVDDTDQGHVETQLWQVLGASGDTTQGRRLGRPCST